MAYFSDGMTNPSMERFDLPEIYPNGKQAPTIDGEKLFDNQDLCSCSISASVHCSVTARWDGFRFCG
jgi:hypothetical protein